MARRAATVTASLAAAALATGCGLFTSGPPYELVPACDVVDASPYLAFAPEHRAAEPDVRTDLDDQTSCFYNVGDGGLIVDVTIWVVAEEQDAESRFTMERDRLAEQDRWQPGALAGQRPWADEYTVTAQNSSASTVHIVALDGNLVASMYVQVAFNRDGVEEITDAALLALVSKSVNQIGEAATVK